MGNSNSTNIGDESSNPTINIIKEKIIDKGHVSEITSIIENENKTLKETLEKAKNIAKEIEDALEKVIDDKIINRRKEIDIYILKEVVDEILNDVERKIDKENQNVVSKILFETMKIIKKDEKKIYTNKSRIEIEKQVIDSMIINSEINKIIPEVILIKIKTIENIKKIVEDAKIVVKTKITKMKIKYAVDEVKNEGKIVKKKLNKLIQKAESKINEVEKKAIEEAKSKINKAIEEAKSKINKAIEEAEFKINEAVQLEVNIKEKVKNAIIEAKKK